MEVPLTTPQPSCFGKHWDPNHVECKGGLDPVYKNPRDDSHRRDRCSWFEACHHRTVSPPAPYQAPSPPIPVQSLIRPTMDAPRPPQLIPPYTPPRPPVYAQQSPQPQVPPPPTSGHQPVYYPPQQQQYPQQMQQMQYPPQQGMLPPHIAQFGPQYVFTPYQLPGSQMPQYLSIPEPVSDDVSWLARLGHEVLRSVFKSFGHSLAAFFDYNPLRRHKK